jgi:hypothetical protein
VFKNILKKSSYKKGSILAVNNAFAAAPNGLSLLFAWRKDVKARFAQT